MLSGSNKRKLKLGSMIACSAGVLLGRANVKSALFVRAAIFDLELEWTVGGRGWGKGDESPARGGC